MSYFTVDDQMHSHDKTLDLVGTAVGRQALGLWTVAGSWCGGHPETMGEVSLKRIRALGFTEKHAKALESVQFWDKTTEGWCFHNWMDRRPNDKKLSKRRDDTRLRVRKHRGNRDCNALHDDTPEIDGNALPGHTVPVPYRTVPDPTGGNTKTVTSTDPGAATGADDSSPQDPLLAFASAWRDLTGRSEFKEFVASGMVGGTEVQALAQFRKACGGSVSEFRARVTARLANDRNDFNLSQTLVRWSSDMINVPAKPPAARSGATAAYHAPLKPRPDDGPPVTFDEAMAGQETPS